MSAKEYPVDDSYDSIAPKPQPPTQAEKERTAMDLVERSLIGCVMVLGQMPDRPPRADEFFDERHRAIWYAISMMAARREGIDLVTVANDLEKTGELAKAGGLTYLASLADRPSPDLLDAYANAVREGARMRRVAKLRAKA